MRFSWDEQKELANRRKHGINFEEASELFTSGVEYLELFDEEHSVDEDRFNAIGPLRRGLVLVVWAEQEEERCGSSARDGQRSRKQSLFEPMRG